MTINATPYTAGNSLTLLDHQFNVTIAENGGLEYSEGKDIKLKATTTAKTGTNNYDLKLNTDGTPYVNVPWTDTTYTTGAGLDLDETTHVLSIERYSTSSSWSGLTFGTNSNGKRGLMLNADTVSRSGITSGDFNLRIDENNVPYTYIPGYVPIEYKSSASSTTEFTAGTLYLIGTWSA